MAVVLTNLDVHSVTWTTTTSANAGEIITVVSGGMSVLPKKKEPSEFCYFHDAVGQPGVISCRYMRVDCPKCGVFKIVSICAHCAKDVESYSVGSRSRCKDCGEVAESRELWKTIGDVKI
jgi:DNA-directed RNA polymerase subunit RPC12/RpoP